jgi:hypothetical protein
MNPLSSTIRRRDPVIGSNNWTTPDSLRKLLKPADTRTDLGADRSYFAGTRVHRINHAPGWNTGIEGAKIDEHRRSLLGTALSHP